MTDYNAIVHSTADHIETVLTVYSKHLKEHHGRDLTVAHVLDALEEVRLRCEDTMEADRAAIKAEWE